MVVEDDPGLRATLLNTLRAAGYATVEAATGTAATDLAGTVELDLVLLDLGLPDVDGLRLCRVLRAMIPCPIVVVTGDDRARSTVGLLDAGADDYLTKPYDTDVLLARVRVALRHRATTVGRLDDAVLSCGDVTVDLAGHQARIGDVVVDTLPRQFDLLVTLCRNPNRILTYDTLVKAIWGFDPPTDADKALRTIVSRLRRDLGSGPQRPRIDTERHVGYRFVTPP